MNTRAQQLTLYGATTVLVASVVIAFLRLNAAWLALPVGLLFCAWAFQKPVALFYVLLAAIPPSVEYQLTATLGTDFPDEPLMLLTALITVFLICFQHKTIVQKQSFHPLLWLLLLQLAWAACTAFTSTHLLLSLKFLAAKSWYLLAFVAAPLLLITTKEKLKMAALVLVSSMMLIVLLSLTRHAADGFLFAAVNRSLAPFFRNHVNYSALLVCILPVLIFGATSVANQRQKIALYGLLCIGFAALYFSYARGAWAALAAGAVAYGLLKKKALVSGYLLVIVFAVAAVFYLQYNKRYLQYAHHYNTTVFHADFSEHLIATYQLKDLSTAERFYRWIAGANMAAACPLTGFGPNTFYPNYQPYTVPAFKTWVSRNDEHSTVHNYFLLLIAEQGVMGLLLFLVLLFHAFYTAQRIYHTTTDVFWKGTAAAVAVILVMICVVNGLSDLIETDKIGSVFYMCLAVLMIADRKTKMETSQLTAHI